MTTHLDFMELELMDISCRYMYSNSNFTAHLQICLSYQLCKNYQFIVDGFSLV